MACLVALAVPCAGAFACHVPIWPDPARADVVLLATAQADVDYDSMRASSARVDKVLRGRFERDTVRLYGDQVRNTCVEGPDMAKGSKLVIYLKSYRDAAGMNQFVMAFWLTIEDASRLDPPLRQTLDAIHR